MNVTVKEIGKETIVFSDGSSIASNHDSDCCEHHYLGMDDLTMEDFEGLEFDLTNDRFFNRIPDYGIELVPYVGRSVRIPGYGYNNGYYSDQLELVLKTGDKISIFNITDCQVISE